MTKTDQDFYAVVRKRRTVRSFQVKPIEQEKLHRVLEAGVRAPTHNHMREWHFVFLKDHDKRQAVL